MIQNIISALTNAIKQSLVLIMSADPVHQKHRTGTGRPTRASRAKRCILERVTSGPQCSRAVWRPVLLVSTQKKVRRLARAVKDQLRTGMSTSRSVSRVKVLEGICVGHVTISHLIGAKSKMRV